VLVNRKNKTLREKRRKKKMVPFRVLLLVASLLVWTCQCQQTVSLIKVDKRHPWCNEAFENEMVGTYLCVKKEFGYDALSPQSFAFAWACEDSAIVSRIFAYDVFMTDNTLPNATPIVDSSTNSVVGRAIPSPLQNCSSQWVQAKTHSSQLVYLNAEHVVPCKMTCRIQDAVSQVVPGGVVVVASGAYQEFVSITKPMQILGHSSYAGAGTEYDLYYRMMNGMELETVLYPDYSDTYHITEGNQSTHFGQGSIVSIVNAANVGIYGIVFANTSFTGIGAIQVHGCSSRSLTVSQCLFWNVDSFSIAYMGGDCPYSDACTGLTINGTMDDLLVYHNMFVSTPSPSSDFALCTQYEKTPAILISNATLVNAKIFANVFASLDAERCMRAAYIESAIYLSYHSNIHVSVDAGLFVPRGLHDGFVGTNLFFDTRLSSIVILSAESVQLVQTLEQSYIARIPMTVYNVRIYSNVVMSSRVLPGIVVTGPAPLSMVEVFGNYMNMTLSSKHETTLALQEEEEEEGYAGLLVVKGNGLSPSLTFDKTPGTESACDRCCVDGSSLLSCDEDSLDGKCSHGSISLQHNKIFVNLQADLSSSSSIATTYSDVSFAAIRVSDEMAYVNIERNHLQGARFDLPSFGEPFGVLVGLKIGTMQSPNDERIRLSSESRINIRWNNITQWKTGVLVYNDTARSSTCPREETSIVLFLNNMLDNVPYSLVAWCQACDKSVTHGSIDATYNYWGKHDNQTVALQIHSNCVNSYNYFANQSVFAQGTVFSSLDGQDAPNILDPAQQTASGDDNTLMLLVVAGVLGLLLVIALAAVASRSNNEHETEPNAQEEPSTQTKDYELGQYIELTPPAQDDE